jgi:hypothetical protein
LFLEHCCFTSASKTDGLRFEQRPTTNEMDDAHMNPSSTNTVSHIVGVILGVAAIVVGLVSFQDKGWTLFSILSIAGGLALAVFWLVTLVSRRRRS